MTTPSRLLKLIIPLTTLDKNSDRKDVEPLALLVHPQQPLSYLERLIQSELPSIKNEKGEEKVPAVHFRAEDSQQDAIEPTEKKADETPEDLYEDVEGELEETKFEGRTEKTGKLGRKSGEISAQLGEGGVESYSGLGHEGPSAEEGSRKFVRWSSSTEVGDFIRDAARGKEFAVEIEGAPEEIKVGVPSFNDRTHYLRLRLRKTASKIIDLAAVKKECDLQAHKGAQRVAMGGAAVLVGYWYVVYRLTFETDLGWDTMVRTFWSKSSIFGSKFGSHTTLLRTFWGPVPCSLPNFAPQDKVLKRTPAPAPEPVPSIRFSAFDQAMLTQKRT